MGLHLLVYRGVQLREPYVNIRNCWDVHSSYDYRCELSGHVKGSTLYSQYFQVRGTLCVYDPIACTPVHKDMNTESPSSALTRTFIPVEAVREAAS